MKTRAEAARLVATGGVRLHRDGASRRLDKAAAEVAEGDTLLLPLGSGFRGVRVRGLGKRRGPAAEARALYEEVAI